MPFCADLPRVVENIDAAAILVDIGLQHTFLHRVIFFEYRDRD